MESHDIYSTAIALIDYKRDLLVCLLPGLLALAFFCAFAFDRVMRTNKTVFGDWINDCSPEAKANFYGRVFMGLLVCIGLCVLGVFSR